MNKETLKINENKYLTQITEDLSYEEALDILNNSIILHSRGNGKTIFCKALYKLFSAVDEAIKYDWHSVEENPDDLPDPEQPCPICVLYYLWKDDKSDENEVDMKLASYDGEDWYYTNHDKHKLNADKIIAWKYEKLYTKDYL